MIEVRVAGEGELSAIADLLERSRLPRAGFPDDVAVALAAVESGRLLGGAALEVHGAYGLLRSVVVEPAARGRGIGQRLTRAILADARGRGLAAVYLLTETAAGFFPRLGFHALSRADVPADLHRSVEFTSACPASAAALWIDLTA